MYMSCTGVEGCGRGRGGNNRKEKVLRGKKKTQILTLAKRLTFRVLERDVGWFPSRSAIAFSNFKMSN